jgi:hypothetical protein
VPNLSNVLVGDACYNFMRFTIIFRRCVDNVVSLLFIGKSNEMNNIKINHFTDLFNLLSSVGLSNTPPFDNFDRTVSRYVSLCGCDRAAERNQSAADARRLYSSLIRNEIQQHVQMIKSKRNAKSISFFEDGKLVIKY